MYVTKIGIVDDERDARARLQEEIASYAKARELCFDVQEFDSAASYLAYAGEPFDILYLDIDLPQMSGMELAEKIRETDSDVIIIFCTNLQQFALNGYAVSATGFIVKPVQEYSFRMFLDRAMKILASRASLTGEAGTVVIKDGSVSKIVEAADIRYVEVRQHYLLYNIRDKATGQDTVIQTRGSMQNAAKQLSRYGFVRCNASFLVNLSWITAVNRLDVYIGQEVLRIGRTYKDAFMGEFARFLAKRG